MRCIIYLMITIVFEPHATTFDNEQEIASGHYDVELSPKGVQQAKELGKRRKDEYFDAIFTSDLQRAYNTAKLAFGNRFPIFQDARLRECDYGDFEHKPKEIVDAERINRISKPFPHGESYEYRTNLLKDFLADLQKNYQGKRVLVIGHRATHYGLDRWIGRKSLKEAILTKWDWQPGWVYHFETLE
jgi:broad specificity phosphatase PhoE